LWFILTLVSTSVEFPICTAVVWSDEREGVADVYASRIDEEGNVEESFQVWSSGKTLLYPRIACSSDSLLLAFWEDYPDSVSEYVLRYAFLDAEGDYYPGSTGEVGVFAAGPAIPVRCREHFALLYTHGYPAQSEYPTWGEVALFDGNTPEVILDVPQYCGQFCYVDNGVWNTERLFCITSYGCIWLEDTLPQDSNQEGYFFPRDPSSVMKDTFEFYREIALAAADTRIGMLYSQYGEPWFDLVDGEGNLLNAEPLYLDLGASDDRRADPTMAYGGGRFVAVVELACGSQRTRALWGAEVDSAVTLLGEGFLEAGPAEEKEPAVSFGEDRFLLVWADNRSGDWDIYGMLFDSLPFSGVIEAAPAVSSPISVGATVFTRSLEIRLATEEPAGRTVVVRDALGRVVRSLRLDGARNSLIWDGKNAHGESVGAGVYFISVDSGTETSPVKVVKL